MSATSADPSVTREPPAGPGRPLLALADGLDRLLGALCRAIVLTTGIAILVLLTSNVIARYVLASGGFRFAQEVPERLFPFLIMAGVVLAVQKGGHLGVETLPGLLGPKGRQWLALVGGTIVIGGYAVLAWQSLRVAQMSWIDLSPILRLPTSYGYYALTGGCIGIMLTTLAITVRVALIGAEALPTADPEEQPT